MNQERNRSILSRLSLRREPHSECQQKQQEDEGADAAGDVAVRYIERDVIAQWNIAFNNSRLPPRGRLQYFSGWGDDG